jgi:colanic acid/amylovoran biosynthesis glycosyltransferase
VTLLGARTQAEVAQILPQAHCYVQPSVITGTGKMEGIPVAIMEALSCALPVVASDISGIPELVRHGETGYLVPPADPLLLADAIEHVYRNPKEAERLGQAGRELVLREFTLNSSITRIAELFSKLVLEA